MEKPSTAKKLSVLIVDDEHGLRDMLSRVLSLKGYEVLAVEDGSVAVERVKERSFDVVICDIRMPGLDGIGTLRAVKSLRPEIAMVMASGYATLETAIEAMKLGAYDYLSKPFELDQLFAVLARAVEHGRLRKLLLEEVSHPTAGVFPTLRSALAPELEIIRAEAERLREAPLAETPAGRILHACDRVRMLLDEAVSPSAPPCE
ncbi:MAG: response regulator [Elusimicrobiota bacterium]